MSVPAAADLAAAGLSLTINVPRVTITVDRRIHSAAKNSALSVVSVLANVGRSLPGSIRLVMFRVIGGSPPVGAVSAASANAASADAASADAASAGAGRGDGGARTPAGWHAALGWLSRPDLFSVAVVSGFAVDGLRLALACDLRVFSEDAYLAMPGISDDAIAALGVSRTLVDLVGYHRAVDLCVTGRGLSGTEAFLMGLAERIAAPADLDRAAEDLASALLAAPREAAIETKVLLLHARDRTRSEQVRAECDVYLRAERDAQQRTEREARSRCSHEV